MKLSKREAALIGLLFVLGGVYLTNNYIFQPLHTQKQQLISENNRLSLELQGLQNRVSKYRSLGQDELKIGVDYQKMLEEVPQSPMIPSIIDYLAISARAANVKLISIRYKEKVVADAAPNSAQSESIIKEVMPLNFQIIASGSHFDLLSFVLEIENAPRIFIINSGKVSLRRTGQSPNGIAAPINNVDMPGNDKIVDKTIPESLTYDQSKSVLELDFSAFYHSSPSNGDA